MKIAISTAAYKTQPPFSPQPFITHCFHIAYSNKMDPPGEGASKDKRKTTKESEAEYKFSMTHAATVCSFAVSE